VPPTFLSEQGARLQINYLQSKIPREQPFDPSAAASPPPWKHCNGIAVAELGQEIGHDPFKGPALLVSMGWIEYVMA